MRLPSNSEPNSGAAVSLLAACDDTALLNAGLFPRQRELAGLIERHPIVVACCGRRFGKTRTTAAAALYNLLLVPELDDLVGSGERRFAVSVANSLAQARIFLEQAAALVKESPLLREELVAERANELEFTRGRTLASFPCTAKSGRGWPISFLLLDEFAHHFDAEEGGPMVAQRIWAAMAPSVAQFGDLGRVVVASTPLGGDGLFAELHAKARGGEIPGAVAFHAPTSANPMISADFLRAREAALGYDDFRREFGAEFLAGGASFIEESRVRAVVPGWRELLPADGQGWVVALDPSFSRDPTAVAVVGRPADDGRFPESQRRLVVGLLKRWLPPRPRRGRYRTRAESEAVMGSILDDVAAISVRYGHAPVVSDQHLPGTVLDELSRRGVRAKVTPWTARSRDEAFQALRARVYTDRIELPDEPQFLAELARLRTRYRAGSATVEVPRVGDSHGDLAVAVALGVLEHDRRGLATANSPTVGAIGISLRRALDAESGDIHSLMDL